MQKSKKFTEGAWRAGPSTGGSYPHPKGGPSDVGGAHSVEGVQGRVRDRAGRMRAVGCRVAQVSSSARKNIF